jgi:Ca2+-binding RTX toxin-like protein
MAGFASWGVDIDRASQIFSVTVDYTIDGYSDPETGEYFGDTSWSAYYYRGSGTYLGGTSGYGSEANTVVIDLGLEPGAGLKEYRLDFSAMNSFSADSVSLTWNVYSAAYDTAAVTVSGTVGMDILIGGSGDDALRGFEGNDFLDGGDGDDILDGGAGADRFNGGAGSDVMIGGLGDDFYQVDSAQDAVIERAAGGYDTVGASVSHTLAAQVEQLYLNAGALNGIGNALDNRIHGNGLTNTLNGLGGQDSLYGGEGGDHLYGGAGNDFLDGGLGNDTSAGGLGDDIYLVDSPSEQVVENPGEGTDTIRVAGLAQYALGANVENLENLFSSFAFRGTGNELNNAISGGALNDTLIGKAGNDSLYGMAGNDVFDGGPGADEIRGGDGIDTVNYGGSAAAVSVDLATMNTPDGKGLGGDAQGDWLLGIENVVGSKFDDVLGGTILDNKLVGGLGYDRLYGGGGNDVLVGGANTDLMDGGDGIDRVSYEGSNIDVIIPRGTPPRGATPKATSFPTSKECSGAMATTHLTATPALTRSTERTATTHFMAASALM